MSYQPSENILNNYANILVNYALNSGAGIKKNETVFLQVPETAKPLLIALQKAVLKAEAHPIIQYIPDELMKDFFDLASDDQIAFFPSFFLKGKIKEADHFISIIAETNKHELEGIDPRKIMERNRSLKPYMDWRNKKELENKFTWTLGLYATEAMAQEAGLSLKECWQQIIKACYLDDSNPIKKWQDTKNEINRIKKSLNSLDIDHLHIESNGTDLIIGVDKNRSWIGGDGLNIPSFEVFISPDWRRTEGQISFDMPLYRYGNIIKDIKLEFKKGIVIKVEAKQGQKIIEEMVKVKNANKIGEFSLTDKRMSHIYKFMAETLFDENFGGEFGNTHIALGMAYKESYTGDLTKVSKKEWTSMGYNDSVIHTDIISTKNRVVTATLNNKETIIIYKDGQFTV
ncbi:MAG: aminopeptidase [Candidatus Shapirobacteria bacterium]|nr:aminopeptidase [Candidatus Shapirobacteria bacterium]